ncbi:MAG TPA: VTT domain-containing protein [Planctomycetota bacterium]|nr:VTT domain-containing protein [Planctomycetota bacterium]
MLLAHTLLQAAGSAAGPVERHLTELAASLQAWPEAVRGVVLAVATFISEDLTTIFAGLLVARGKLDFTSALIACTAGIWVGDGGLWALGRLFGRPALRLPLMRRWIPPESVARAERWFAHRGLRVVIVSRFLPGSRVAAFFTAGMLGARASWFLGWALLAALVWTPMLLGAAVIAAPQIEQGISNLLQLQGGWRFVAPVLSFVVLVCVLRGLELASDWRARRLWRAKWVRRLRWEFWPRWLLCAPCLPWYLLLAARHRSLTLPALANPGLQAHEDSKALVLQALVAGRAEAQVFVARTCRLQTALDGGTPEAAAAEARWLDLSAWMAREALDFPLVLKPDVGRRGHGARLVSTEAEARSYLRAMPFAAVAQEYAPGPHELGIVWVRAPGEAQGRILSVTEKVFPEVVGDGEHDLHDLILLHPRAVLQHRLFLRGHAEQLDWIPGLGAQVPLVTAGHDSQGAIFKDDTRLAGDALRARLDALVPPDAGLCLGRFELRVPDLAALQRGEGFRIVEFGSVAAEATPLDDPQLGPWRGLRLAWRTLIAQWRLLFEIGAANRAAGHRAAGAGTLWRRWRESRRLRKWHPPAD